MELAANIEKTSSSIAIQFLLWLKTVFYTCGRSITSETALVWLVNCFAEARVSLLDYASAMSVFANPSTIFIYF